MVCFGIAPYIREKVVQNIQQAECFTMSFDESLNRECYIGKMDLMVWYCWQSQAKTQYFDSLQLGPTVGKGLLECFKSGISELNYVKVLYVSMDVPKVNQKLSTLLCEDRNKVDANLPKLLNVESCGLHVVHRAFLLESSLLYGNQMGYRGHFGILFHDSPARREDYITLTG